MPCTDDNPCNSGPAWARWAARVGLSLLLAGCGSPLQKPPQPGGQAELARPGPQQPQPPQPGRGDNAPPATKPAHALPPPEPVSSHEALRRQAALRLVAANPERSYMGEVPAVLLAIPVLEIELYKDGRVKQIHILRKPGQALDTIELAIAAVHRAAPFGDVSQLPRPWKFNEVFLFNDERRFKPRTLDE